MLIPDDFTYAAIKYLLRGFLLVLACMFVYWLGYREGIDVTEAKYQREIRASEQRAEEQFRRMQQSQNDEIRDYLSKIDELNAQHDADVEALKNAQFKDTVTVTAATHNTECDRVSDSKSSSSGMPKTKAQSDLLCYSREELQQKVARSLAITRDADELREKYQALIKICTD
jgi:hypothetical protein